MAQQTPGYPPPFAPRIGVIADDLTGAGDTALQFLAMDGEVWIQPELADHVHPPSGIGALAVNADYRHLLPQQAAAQVDRAARWLHRGGCGRFYLKVDSTLRGHVAVGALQALSTLGLELAVVAPAFPQAGRITVGGYQLVDGIPVNASPYARDVLAPVTQAHLPTLLAQTSGYDVEFVSLDEVMQGPERVAAGIIRAIAGRKRLLVADAVRWEDLLTISRGIAITPYRVLPVGSAGLARAMQPHLLLDRGKGLANPAAGRVLIGQRPPVLVVAGSLNAVTRAQVDHLAPICQVVTLDVAGLLLATEPAIQRAVGQVLPLLVARQDVIIRTSHSEGSGRTGHALGRDLGMTTHQVAGQLGVALGRVVARLVAEVPLSGVILTGGDTALAVCRGLGGPPMQVLDQLMPAIPLCRLEGPTGPLRVVTKSGGFGPEDTLTELVDRLKRSDVGT